ncbi:unnamed protein product [Natator depressus]
MMEIPEEPFLWYCGKTAFGPGHLTTAEKPPRQRGFNSSEWGISIHGTPLQFLGSFRMGWIQGTKSPIVQQKIRMRHTEQTLQQRGTFLRGHFKMVSTGVKDYQVKEPCLNRTMGWLKVGKPDLQRRRCGISQKGDMFLE